MEPSRPRSVRTPPAARSTATVSLPHRLPLFPLGVVLFPDEPIPLHIFEPRYREMVKVCIADELAFGIAYVSEEALAEVGCTARIRRVLRRYDDGRLDIVAVGEERFRVVSVHRDRPYLTAEVAPVADRTDADPLDPAERERVITQHMKLLEMAGETIRPSLYEGAPSVAFAVAQNAGLRLEKKQMLLEMTSEAKRVAFLVEHFQDLLARVGEAQSLKDRVQGDGQADGFPTL